MTCCNCGFPIADSEANGPLRLLGTAFAHLEYRCIELLKLEIGRLSALLNTPETEDFDKAVLLEAAHQQERWGAAHDAGKNPEDWFWLVGYLAGKALGAMKVGDDVKAKHHCISTVAALRNWHAAIRQGWSFMRPGISEEKQAVGDA